MRSLTQIAVRPLRVKEASRFAPPITSDDLSLLFLLAVVSPIEPAVEFNRDYSLNLRVQRRH